LVTQKGGKGSGPERKKRHGYEAAGEKEEIINEKMLRGKKVGTTNY